MRELQLWDTGEAAAGTFGDIAALGEGCRFRDCAHETEPGCAVVAAVAAGELSAVAARELPQAAESSRRTSTASRTSARSSTRSAAGKR